MSLREYYYPYISDSERTCPCRPRHTCLRNKGVQVPPQEPLGGPLRDIDLIPLPRPLIRSGIQVKDFACQVSLQSYKHQLNFLEDKAISSQGASLFAESASPSEIEDIDEELDRLILQYTTPKKEFVIKRSIKRRGWPQEFQPE